MTNLKNVSASITSRSNSFCLDWGTPDFQIPESKCALCHFSNLLRAGLGVPNTKTPWKGNGGRCSILPGTPHPDTQEPKTAPELLHTPIGLLRNSFLLGLISSTLLLTPSILPRIVAAQDTIPFNHILFYSPPCIY